MLDYILKTNRHIIFPILVITVIGTLFIINITDIQFRENADSFIRKRIITVIIGFILMAAVFSVETKKIKEYAVPFMIFSFFMLSIILIPGIGMNINGARRWIGLSGMQVQPSEFAKIAVIIGLAAWLAKIRENKFELRYLKKEMLVIIGFFILIALEPDLGNAMILSLTALILIYIAGFNIKILVICVLILAVLASLFIIFHPWRMERVKVAFNPEIDRFDKGYQPYKSILGIATGGLTGKGYGNSFNKCFFLRESHTDYIFSIYAEETGLLGSLSLIILYVILIFEGFHISFVTSYNDFFNKYAVFGMVFLLGLQICLNLCVAVSLLPSKGLPLPLFSFGGSSYLATMMMIGFILRVDYENKKQIY